MKRIVLGAALILAAVVAAVSLAAGTATERPRQRPRAPSAAITEAGSSATSSSGASTAAGIASRTSPRAAPPTKLTAINYAFGNVAPDGAGGIACKLGDEWADYQVPWTAEQSVTGTEITWPRRILGNFQQLQALKELHPNVKVLISLGGWTWSRYFSDAALTPASRERFVASCIDLFIKGNLPDPGWGGMGGPGAAAGVFDGIDLDWEWPGSDGNVGNVIRPEDKANFTLLLAEFRRQLDAYGATAGRSYLLTAFLPAAPAKIDAGFQVNRIFDSLDSPRCRATTCTAPGRRRRTTSRTSGRRSTIRRSHGSRSTTPSRRTSARCADRTSWSSACRSTRAAGPASARRTMVCTNRLLGRLPEPGRPGSTTTRSRKPGSVRATRGTATATPKAAWLFDGTTFWTFDDPTIMNEKAHYVRKENLGGIMFWELSGDTPDGELIDAIADGLG